MSCSLVVRVGTFFVFWRNGDIIVVIYFIPFVMRMAEKLNNLDANQVNAIMSSIDPNEIKKFVVRWDKIKIKLESWRKIKLKWVDTKAFQERSDKKVAKDVNVQQLVTVLNNQGNKTTPEQLMNTKEVSDLKQLLEQYRKLLEQYEAQFGTLKAGINTNVNSSVWNSVTGNPQEYNTKTWFIDNNALASVNNSSVTPNNIVTSNTVPNKDVVNYGATESVANWWPIAWVNVNNKGKIEYGATGSVPMSGSETKNSVSDSKEKIPDDAVAYNYQSIYELDQSGLKGIENMSNREIIRKLFRAKNNEFVDIIETKWKENKTTIPSSAEREFLRTFFKQPMNNLVTKRDIDPLELWEEMEKVVKNNPTVLAGMSNYEKNIDFWMQNEIFSDKMKGTSALNRLFKSDKEMVAKNLAKLSAMYVDVNNNKGQYAYTNRLFAMMDRAWGVDYKFAAGWLKNIINTNRDNVGQVKLSDGSELLDTKKDLSQAKKLLIDIAWGNIPWYISDSALTENALKDVLNKSVKWTLKPSTDGLRTLMNNFKGLNESFDMLASHTPDSGHMDAWLMLAEGKAFGATDAEVYNIKAVAEKWVLSTKYGPISDATRLMNFFADYNNNGKGGDAADFGGFSGAQLLWNYRQAVNKLQFNNGGMEKSAAESKIVSGILNKIYANALQWNDLYVANVIQTYLKNKSTDMMSLIKDHPAIVKYVQNYLKNFAWNNLYALMFVDEKRSLNTFQKEVEATAQNDVQSLSSQLQKIQDPIERAQVEQIIKQRALALQSDIRTQSANLSPDEQKYFNSFDLASLEQNVAHTVFRAIQVNPSLNGALGAGVAVDLAKNIQLNLSAATGKNGVTVPSLGLGFKSDSGVFGSNVNVTHLGANAAAFVRFGERSNSSKLSNTLKPLTYKTTSLTGNVSGGIWFDRVPHVGAGLQLQTSNDKLKWINIITDNIRQTTLGFLPSVLDAEWVRLISAINAQSQVEGRTISQLDSFINSPRTQFLNRVKEQLRKKYNADQSDSALIDQAANNILSAILQAELQPGSTLTNKVADYMATQWRNAALDKLTHSYELTSLWIGIGAFINPTNLSWPLTVGASLSAWLSKYDRGAGAVNSVESYEKLRQADEYGVDNLDLKMDAPTFVKYLNGMMDVSRGMPEYKDGKIVRNFPEIRVSDDGKFIVIPADLWKYDNNLTLNIADDAQVSRDNNQNILIPRGEDMRMVSLGDQNKAIYKLNVGSAVTSGKDHVMRRFNEDFNKKNSDGKDIFVNPDQIQHRKKMNIVLNEQSTATLKSILGSDANDFKIENNNLLYTKWGQQQSISLNGGTVDGWAVALDAGGIEFTKPSPNGGTEKLPWVPLIYEFVWFHETMKNINENAPMIEKWERNNGTKVKDFYEAAIVNDDVKALSYLKWLAVPWLQALIEGSDTDAKSQLVSYMTEAFALEEVGYKNMTAIKLMTARDKWSKTPAYARVKGNVETVNGKDINISSLFSRDELRNIYASSLETPSNKWEPQKDLIGYTAFYRKNANKQERGYAMTLPGYTRVLWGKINPFEDATKEQQAKDWLMAKIKKDEFAKKAILASLSTKDLGPVSQASIAKLSPDELVTLLTSKDWLSIDGCILSIEATPVFYLLAECANESLGLQLKAITCKDKNGVEIKKVSTDMTEEFEDGDYKENVSNAGAATRTLGKRTIFKVAVGAATTFNGWSNNSNQAPGDDDGTIPSDAPGDDDGTNPGWTTNNP